MQPNWQKISYSYNNIISNPSADWQTLVSTASSLAAPAKTVLLFETAFTGGDVIDGVEHRNYFTAAGNGVPEGQGTCTDIVNKDGHPGGFYATGFMAQRGGTLIDLNAYNSSTATTLMNANTAAEFFGATGRHLDGSNFLCADGHVKMAQGRFRFDGRAGRDANQRSGL